MRSHTVGILLIICLTLEGTLVLAGTTDTPTTASGTTADAGATTAAQTSMSTGSGAMTTQGNPNTTNGVSTRQASLFLLIASVTVKSIF